MHHSKLSIVQQILLLTLLLLRDTSAVSAVLGKESKAQSPAEGSSPSPFDSSSPDQNKDTNIAEFREFPTQKRYQCNQDERKEHPHYCHLMDRAATDPRNFAAELHEWSKRIGFVIGGKENQKQKEAQAEEQEEESQNVSTAWTASKRNLRGKNVKVNIKTSKLPTVMAHGMGDSCFNNGMQSITQRVSSLTNQYATCIPTGDNLHDDIMNGYFMSMNANIDVFASKIKNDPKLSNGFHAIGFSQGNNVIRGYIAKYNDPPVHTFIAVNGVNAGIGAVPYCIPKGTLADVDPDVDFNVGGNDDPKLHGRICNGLMEVASHRAYSDFSQTHSFQANYWRDPRPEERQNYLQYSQLAKLGNEVAKADDRDPILNENYAKTQKFVWIKAKQDSIVWPREGEQWGAPNSNAEDPFMDILPMDQTEWYEDDLFGLKSADLEGKNAFEEFEGDHLAFDMEEFDNWVHKYFIRN